MAAALLTFACAIGQAQPDIPCSTLNPVPPPNGDPPTYTVSNLSPYDLNMRFYYRTNTNSLASWLTTVNSGTQEVMLTLPGNADRIEQIRVYCAGSNTNTLHYMTALPGPLQACANPNSGLVPRGSGCSLVCLSWSGATCTYPAEQNCFDDGSMRIVPYNPGCN